MSLTKPFKGEAETKELLNKFYKENGMIEGSFDRNFIAHKTIDFLYEKGLLRTPNEKES